MITVLAENFTIWKAAQNLALTSGFLPPFLSCLNRWSPLTLGRGSSNHTVS